MEVDRYSSDFYANPKGETWEGEGKKAERGEPMDPMQKEELECSWREGSEEALTGLTELDIFMYPRVE